MLNYLNLIFELKKVEPAPRVERIGKKGKSIIDIMALKSILMAELLDRVTSTK